MDPTFRRAYNEAFSPALYDAFIRRFEAHLGCKIPYRVAETPLFLPPLLRGRLERHAREIVEQISEPALIEKMKKAIPPHLDVPGMDALPSCTQVDFAITRDANGDLDGKVVELQAFPSLYALMVVQAELTAESMAHVPELARPWSIYFDGGDRDAFVRRLKRAVVGDHDPETVVLLDLDPPAQKTYPDFIATKQLLDVDAVCPTSLIKDGRKLYRKVGSRLVRVERIYNRIVFDELLAKKTALPFSYTDDLDVTWCSHPNWYWTHSKYTLPYVDHASVPRARYVSEIERLPDDLGSYVLKPLFSFAGTGVIIDVTRADVDAIPEAERGNWILQEKITYEPALAMPDGTGVKAEIRMMFLRAPDEAKPTLVLNLVRLSRGKMLGVDQNKDLTWVGGTIGMWPA